ncbi:hypothetical protein [Propionivibrio sp.]|uniref:hypothetical protein n=1 Tax=Propionivibrio sp. TaxID=2212460 RepID=UPI0039E64A77
MALLEDRKPNVWVVETGLDRSVIRNAKEKGAIPGWETLFAIRRAEGVRVEWLTEGQGEPFEVWRFVDEDECAETLDTHLHDEPWTVTIATDGQRHAAVLSQPMESEVHGRAGRVTTYRYLATEILLGVRKKSLDAIMARGRDIRLAKVSAERIDAIYGGQAGTYRLLRARDAWLGDAKPIDARHAIFTQAEPEPRVLTNDEEQLIQIYGSLAAEKRATYKAIGHTLAQQEPSGEAAD